MKCPRCGSEDNFYILNNRYYCRECIQFKRVFFDETQKQRTTKEFPHCLKEYTLPYKLSKKQLEISHELLNQYQNNENSLVYAVCGSGKTEIVLETMQYALSLGHRICFCMPRRDIAIEIYHRLKEHYYDIDISLVHGGHTHELEGQIVVCTTHQLYRYEHAFELLILDEFDAFPYKDNQVLQSLVKKACINNYIYLSATPSCEDINNHDHKVFILNQRYHLQALPVPQIFVLPRTLILLHIIIQLKKYKKEGKPCILFVATKKDVEIVVQFLKRNGITAKGVHSQIEDKQKYIQEMRDKHLLVLVSTTILERGVTFENLQVIVYRADHIIFDQDTLIQIAGRVGRKIGYTQGDVRLYGTTKTKEMKQCVNKIKQLNMNDV